MKVLLCLLSDQHVPNTLSVHHVQPDRLVLLQSDAMKRRNVAQRLLDALKLGGLDYSERCDIEALTAEDELEAIRVALRRAYGRFPSAEWTINLAGGTKPMSIATYEFFRALNGRMLYMNAQRPSLIADINGGKAETCAHRLGIGEFLAGYGFNLRKSPDKIQEGENRAQVWWRCAATIAEHAPQESLLNLNDESRKCARDKGWRLASGELTPSRSEVREALQATFDLSYEGGAFVGKLDKYQAQFLTGGWLEVFIWGLLERHATVLGIWDVRLGFEVGLLGAATGNDFDVSFMHEYGLCVIECKSGAQEHDPGLDVLYKVEAVVRQFRALRVKSWLATTSDLIIDKSTGKVKAAIENRARIYDCQLILHKTIEELARCFGDAERVRSAFFPAREP